MTNRRKARILAMQMLYQVDAGKVDPDDLLYDLSKNLTYKQEIKNFAVALFKGSMENIKQIDELISKLSTNWPITRMPHLDRNILRFAMYEIMYLSDIPKSVAINEAIEIAKKYSTDDSGKFINGILDKVEKNVTLS